MPHSAFRTLLAVLFLGIAWGCGYESPLLAQGKNNPVKRYDNSVVLGPPTEASIAVTAALSEHARRTAVLRLHFALATNNIEELESRVAKGERLSPKELDAKYSG